MSFLDDDYDYEEGDPSDYEAQLEYVDIFMVDENDPSDVDSEAETVEFPW